TALHAPRCRVHGPRGQVGRCQNGRLLPQPQYYGHGGLRRRGLVAGSALAGLAPAQANALPGPIGIFTVAQDGSGDFRTVQEAINAVPDLRKKETTIFIKKGIYKEKLVLAGSKTL
nr:pectinesterase 31-like protein [Tanacetum cinerariifolium]